MKTINKILLGVGASVVVGGAAYIGINVIAKKKNQEEAEKVSDNPEMYEESPEQIQEMVDNANEQMDKRIKVTKVIIGVGALLASIGVVCNVVDKNRTNNNVELLDNGIDVYKLCDDANTEESGLL